MSIMPWPAGTIYQETPLVDVDLALSSDQTEVRAALEARASPCHLPFEQLA